MDTVRPVENDIYCKEVIGLVPPTEEIKCLNDDCFLDMFENHYTYDVPDDYGIGDVTCPVCGGTDCLEGISV